MSIAYLTVDQVNQSLAQEWSAHVALNVEILMPRDGYPDSCYTALVVDLDYLPAELRGEVLAELLRSPLARPTAVHGYNLTDEQIATLKGHGVIVHRRLSPKLFRRLRDLAVERRMPSFQSSSAI